jgi:hypothetical protein
MLRNICFASVWFAMWAYGQTSRGTVTGLVSDAQKGAIPNAPVELTNTATNVARATRSNESGLYRFDAVDPGEYRIAVKMAGFHTYAGPKLSIGAAQTATHDVVLEVGDVQQVIEVTESVVQLQTEAPVRGKNVGFKDIAQLPYASRNPVDLGLTAPGVTTTKFATPTRTFVVNGARGRSNNFMIDGTDNNDISVAGQAFQVLNPGSVQEVSVQTTNYDAEFGRAGGAVVNVVTRSGTNRMHGTAGFVLDSTRDDAISSSLAADPAVQARGKNLAGTEQQFDGTLGGPIRKDQTFYHLSYLELRQFSTSSNEMTTPTAAGRATLRRLFPSGQNRNADILLDISNGFDGVTRVFNVPLGDGRPDVEFGRLITPFAQKKTVRQYGAKIDHRFGNNDLLSGRFLFHDSVEPNGGETLSFPSFITSSFENTKSASLYYTHVFSPAVTNELRPGFTRYILDSPLDMQNPLGRTLPSISIQGINTTAASRYGISSTFPQGRKFNNYVLQDTLSVVRGTHTLRGGFDLMEQRAFQAAPFNLRGTLAYSASSGYSGLANFLADFGGAGGSAARAFGSPNYYPSLFRQAYFFQDRWRASASLTLTLGLRYEYFGTPMNVMLNPVYTGLFNVDPVTLRSPLHEPNSVLGDKNNFSPTFGLAYSPDFDSGPLAWLFAKRKGVLRMGYAMGYDSYFNNMTSNMVASAPNAVSGTTPSQATVANPRGVGSFFGQLPATAPPITPFLSQSAVYKNLVNPYYQRWSAGIQREMPFGILFDAAYVGTRGIRLFASEDGNPLVTQDLRGPVPPNVATSQREARLDPLQGGRLIRSNGGSSIYHGAQFEAKRRFSNGLSFTAAYTRSKVIDNGSEIFSYGNTSSLQQSSVPSFFGGLQIDRGVGFFDRPNRLVFTYIYDLPLAKAQRGVAGKVLGGWQIAGITTYESGVPYTVVNGQDADGVGGATYDRPNLNLAGRAGVRAVPNATSSTGYVNPDDGNRPIDPATARYIGIAANNGVRRSNPGNLGRNTERGPGLKNWDVNIVKNIAVAEGVRIEFRSEFFNIWNTPMYGKVSVSPFAPAQNAQTIGASVFGSSPGLFLNETAQDGGARVIRFQLRFHF